MSYWLCTWVNGESRLFCPPLGYWLAKSIREIAGGTASPMLAVNGKDVHGIVVDARLGSSVEAHLLYI